MHSHKPFYEIIILLAQDFFLFLEIQIPYQNAVVANKLGTTKILALTVFIYQ